VARKRSTWRTAVIVFLCVGVVGLWGSLLYQVVAARQIEAQVLSCADHSCEVAWSYGGTHGVTTVDAAGGVPGGLMNVDYTPGIGVTNREEDLAFVLGLPLVLGIAFGFVHWRGPSGRARYRAP